MQTDKYLKSTLGVFEKAKQEAQFLNLKSVDLDVFSAVFFDNMSLGCVMVIDDPQLIHELIEESFDKINNKTQHEFRENIQFTPKLKKFIDACENLALELFELDYVAPEVILLNLIAPDFATPILKKRFFNTDGSYNDLANDLIWKATCYLKDEDEEFLSMLKADSSNEALNLVIQEDLPDTELDILEMFSDNKILSEFGENLNIKAVNGDFDKVVDFDGKIDELATILCRKKKPNAILVGPAGTGKTSIVEGLAASIVEGKAPELLSNKVIYSVSLSSMVAGTQFRGQFEERLENFVNEAKKYENLILFIDEIHTLVGAGGSQENSLEASNILKPELARGTISCIGATTINEYTNTIKKDSALDRRFESVAVREPSKFQMKQIIPSIVEFYESFHKVQYSQEFLDNVLDYCERFMPNKCYPDKAVDVIDHCGAQAKVKFWKMDDELQDLKSQIVNKEESEYQIELFAEFQDKRDLPEEGYLV